MFNQLAWDDVLIRDIYLLQEKGIQVEENKDSMLETRVEIGIGKKELANDSQTNGGSQAFSEKEFNKFSDMVIQNPAHHRGELKNNKARSFLDCPLNVGDGALSISNVIMGEAESRIKSNDLFLKKNIALADNGDSINGSPEAQVSMNSEAINVAKNPPTRICGKQFGSFKGSLRACLQRSNFGLNNSQRKAILAAASQRLTLWQGPPGTGKTKTLVILIAILCQLQQGKILACADR
eukprot:Gb_24647 [translate_table: standard]